MKRLLKNHSSLVKLLIAVGVNLIIFLFFTIAVGVTYGTVDNMHYSQFVVDGYYDNKYLTFFYLAFCGIISKIIYPVNAFAIMQLILCFCAATAITRIFLDKFNYILAILMTFFINGFYALNYYSVISFTMAPGIIFAGGFICILHYINRKKWVAGTVIGSILLIFGSLFRFEVTLVLIAAAGIFFVAKCLCEYFYKSKDSRKITDFLKNIFSAKRLIAFVLILVMIFGLNIASMIIDTSSSELKYFKEYTEARTTVYDYNIPSYEEAKSDYDAIDINENDLFMQSCQYLDDEGAFPIEQLYKMADVQAKYEESTSVKLKNMVVDELMGIRTLTDKGIAEIGFAIILIVFFLVMKKRNYFIPFALVLICLLVYSYLWIQGRVPLRAVYMLWISCSVYLLYSFSYTECREWVKNKYKRKKVFLSVVSIEIVLLSVLGFVLSKKANYWSNYNGNTNTAISETGKYILDNRNNKYIFSHSSKVSMGEEKNNPFITYKTNFDKNYLEYNGTYYRYTWYEDQVKALGTDNMYSYLLEDNVYMVDGRENPHAEHFKEYLQEYYANGKTVDYKTVKQIDDNNIIKFSIR